MAANCVDVATTGDRTLPFRDDALIDKFGNEVFGLLLKFGWRAIRVLRPKFLDKLLDGSLAVCSREDDFKPRIECNYTRTASVGDDHSFVEHVISCVSDEILCVDGMIWCHRCEIIG